MKYAIFSRIRRLALITLFATASPLYASDHGGGGAAGLGPLQFTVNIGSAEAMRFLQVEVVLEFATPEAAMHLAAMKPKVQHRIIMLLTSEEIASLQTTKGKLELQERIVGDLNTVIDETPKTGVKEALFTSFIIQ